VGPLMPWLAWGKGEPADGHPKGVVDSSLIVGSQAGHGRGHTLPDPLMTSLGKKAEVELTEVVGSLRVQ
jgi:hypothetical protein